MEKKLIGEIIETFVYYLGENNEKINIIEFGQ